MAKGSYRWWFRGRGHARPILQLLVTMPVTSDSTHDSSESPNCSKWPKKARCWCQGRGRETGQERKRSGTRDSQTANHNMTQPGGSNPDSPPASHCALSQHSTTFLRMPALKGVSGCVAAVRGDTGSRGPWRPGRGPCEAHVDQAARPEAT